MSKIVPTISSGTAGPLGVLHLPRLWQKVSLDAAGKLHDDYPAIGIDRFVPESEYTLNGATIAAYGLGKMPMLFIIDPDGVIRHFETGLEGLGEALSR